jgi:hypothetical protein
MTAVSLFLHSLDFCFQRNLSFYESTMLIFAGMAEKSHSYAICVLCAICYVWGGWNVYCYTLCGNGIGEVFRDQWRLFRCFHPLLSFRVSEATRNLKRLPILQVRPQRFLVTDKSALSEPGNTYSFLLSLLTIFSCHSSRVFSKPMAWLL